MDMTDYTSGLGGIYEVNPETGEVVRVVSDAPAPEPEVKAAAPAKAKASKTTTEDLTDAPAQ